MRKLFLMAATAAMAMVSCDKESGGNVPETGNAQMNVVISFPKTMGTRAADTNASTKDVEIETVTVFVFDGDGNGVLGNGASFTDADFIPLAGNKYKLDPAKRILTTAGPKRIYVGINLPTALAGAATESVLIDKASAVGLEGANSVAMLSDLAEKTLVAQENDTDPTPAANVVPTQVKRLVAKIAVTAGTASDYTLAGPTADVAATFTITPDQFAVGNLATTFYPVQRLTGGMLVTPGDDVNPAVTNFRDINAAGTAVSSLAAFYVPEHSDMARTFLQGDLTYAVVRSEFTFAKWAKVGSSSVEFEDVTTLSPGSFVYSFRIGEATYFCQSNSVANQVKNELGYDPAVLLSDAYEVAADGKLYTYYYLFLNKDEVDMLAVKRNQFFNIKVADVAGLGLPNIVPDPDEPVVGTTNLEVSVDVLEWDYKSIDQILGQ
jgi:hypothetical protein